MQVFLLSFYWLYVSFIVIRFGSWISAYVSDFNHSCFWICELVHCLLLNCVCMLVNVLHNLSQCFVVFFPGSAVLRGKHKFQEFMLSLLCNVVLILTSIWRHVLPAASFPTLVQICIWCPGYQWHYLWHYFEYCYVKGRIWKSLHGSVLYVALHVVRNTQCDTWHWIWR